MRIVGLARVAGLLMATGMVAAACPPPDEPKALDGTCFVRDAANVLWSAEAGDRVRAVTVRFQEFQGGLLAGVSYKLRYGPEFGFSGDCSKAVGGGFECKVCPDAACRSDQDAFSIVVSGADTLRLVGDKAGVRAQNPQGGRDRLRLAADQPSLELRRVAAEACSL